MFAGHQHANVHQVLFVSLMEDVFQKNNVPKKMNQVLNVNLVKSWSARIAVHKFASKLAMNRFNAINSCAFAFKGLSEIKIPDNVSHEINAIAIILQQIVSKNKK